MKIKTNLKILLILGIILCAMLLFATNKVDATEITEAKLEEIFNSIPDAMNLDIKEVEYQKVPSIVSNNIVNILNKNNIQCTEENSFWSIKTLKMKDITLNDCIVQIDVNPVMLSHRIDNFYKDSISIQLIDKEGVTKKELTKDINLTYSNHNQYNKTDEQYVKNLKIESPRYHEMSEISITDWLSLNIEAWESKEFKLIENHYTNLINDKSITIKADYSVGGGEVFTMWSAEAGTSIGIFKNGILYDIRVMGREATIPVITVPSSINDSELNDYIIKLLNEYLKNIEDVNCKILSIKKGATISDEYEGWSKEVSDGYTVELLYDWANEESIEDYIIVKKEEKIEKISASDENTNIQLEAQLGVIPENTVLDVNQIKNDETYNNIKKTLSNTNKFVAFDITLKSNGVEIQPNGKVKISIPIPENFDTSNLKVYRIEDNGTKFEYNVNVLTIDGIKYAQFETDHFSTYVLAQIENEKDDTPKTGIETNSTMAYTIVFTVATIALGAVLVISKKH